MPAVPSNYRPDIRPFGPSGSLLRSDPSAANRTSWFTISQGDIQPGFAVTGVTTDPTTVLVGTGIINPTFTFSYNAVPSGTNITAVGSGTQVVSTPFNSGAFSGTFTYSVPTGQTFLINSTGTYGTYSSGITINWQQRQYWGSSATGTYNSSFITALANSGFNNSHNVTFSVTAATGECIFYAFRAAYGHPDFLDNFSSLRGGFSLVGSGISFTNAAGVSESYNIYKSDQATLGVSSITVENSGLYPQTIDVISEIVPRASGAFPVADVYNIRGAVQSVADLTARNNIPLLNRKVGMLVHLQSTDSIYRLVGGISDSSWTLQSTFGFSQSFTSSISWVVIHSLGYYPNITVLDSNGNIVLPSIVYDSLSKVTLGFNKASAGTVYCS